MIANRLLILSSSTGGGHDMRASALEAWVKRIHGDRVEVRRWQALEEGTRLDRFGVQLYNTIQRRAPWAHHIYFNFLECASLHRSADRLRGQAPFQELLESFRPEVIVSVHAHLNHGYFEFARKVLANDVRCITYCGELCGGYGFSKHWVNPAVDRMITAVDLCAEAAIARKIDPDKVRVGGFLLHPPFFEPDNDSMGLKLRKEFFGDDHYQPTLLLGTGSNGANNHLRVLMALARLQRPLNLLVLCGRNDVVFQRIDTAARTLQPLRVVPLRYRQDMHHLFQAVDCAFIRPGTGTTSECIRSGCPVIFNGIGGVMPQERITVKFMRAHGLEAPVASTARAFARRVNDWLNRGFAAEAQRQRSIFEHINRGLTPETIVHEVLE